MTNSNDNERRRRRRRKTDSFIEFEFSRGIRSLMIDILDIKEDENKIAELKLKLVNMEHFNNELLLQLKYSKEEVKQLTMKLENANNEIDRLDAVLSNPYVLQDSFNVERRCSGQDRRQIDMPYSGQDRRQYSGQDRRQKNLPASQQ